MGALLADLAGYLDTALGTHSQGSNLFAGDLPHSPDDVVGADGPVTALFETPGSVPVETLGVDGQPAVTLPRVQVQTRAGGATAYVDSRTRAREVYAALVVVTNEDVGGALYYRVAPLQEPFLLHRDESERVVFAFNCEVWRVAESSVDPAAVGEQIREQLKDERNARVVLRSMAQQLKAAVALGELLLGDDAVDDDAEPDELVVRTLGGVVSRIEVPPDRFPDPDAL